MKQTATAQAEASGVSLNQYIVTVLATGISARAEAERYFSARKARALRVRAKYIPARWGIDNPPRSDDLVG